LFVVRARNRVTEVPVVTEKSFVAEEAFPTSAPVNVVAATEADDKRPVLG
jgi:hypothetical protein